MENKTKDKVKKIARSLFAANGYDATTMDQIATGVGIKKPTLYAYTTGKEELFLAIYEELEQNYRNHMEQLIKDTEDMLPPERLYYLFKQYLLYSLHDLEVAAFWNRVIFFPPLFLKDSLTARVLSNEMQIGQKLLEIIKTGMQQGAIRNASPDELLLSYYSLREGLLALTLVFKRPEENVNRIEQTWQNFWLGIKKYERG